MLSSTDVLVVGAGPVGLLLACELRRQGVNALLVERQPAPSYFCKALGVTPRTLEIFEDLGMAEEAIDAGVWLTGQTSFANGVETASQDLAVSGLPYGFLALPQYDTERILEACLRRHGGTVERGFTLTAFAQGTDDVQACFVDGTGAEHRVSCRWLVGCDGAHSVVRKGLGLAFEGDKYSMTFMLGDVDVGWDLPRGRVYRFAQVEDGQLTNLLVAVPVRGSPRRYRLSTAVPETTGEGVVELGAEAQDAPTLERLAAVAAPMLPAGTRLSDLRWSSTYRISHRIVPRYAMGRVFLAGDAAHIHPPIGGQGMNTGLQDAHNLAWKLVLAARGLAAPGLLESYSAERQPVGREVVEQTSRAMDDAIANRPVSQDPLARESQLFVHYRTSPLVRDDMPAGAEADAEAPRPGDRAPDADGLRRPFVARPIRLRDRLGRGRHLLLAYADAGTAGSDYAAFADLLDALRGRLGDLAAGVVLLAPDARPVDLERIPFLSDAGDAFRRAYGARPGMVWLLRPDGHIGWRCDRPDSAGLLRFLDRIVSVPAAAV